MVDLPAPGGQDDGGVGADDGGVGLEEEDGPARGRRARPRPARRVVRARAHDLGARDDRGDEPDRVQRHDLAGGLGRGAEGVPLEDDEAPLGLARGVGLVRGQALDNAVAELVAGGEARDLHARSV